MNFNVEKSETLFKGKVFDIQLDEIVYNSGNKGRREVVIHPGGAVVLAVTDKSKIITVKQYRYPFKEFVTELPAGKLDDNEDPLECAKRELQEETGYTAKEYIKLGKMYSSPGFCSEILHIYLAKNLTAGDHRREEGEENMEVYEYSFDEMDKMISEGEIVDAKTICGLYMARKYFD